MAFDLITRKRRGRDWSCSISGDDSIGDEQLAKKVRKNGGLVALAGASLYLAARNKNLVVEVLGKDKSPEMKLIGKVSFLGGAAAFLLGQLGLSKKG